MTLVSTILCIIVVTVAAGRKLYILTAQQDQKTVPQYCISTNSVTGGDSLLDVVSTKLRQLIYRRRRIPRILICLLTNNDDACCALVQ